MLIKFYYEENIWLFGGTYKISKRNDEYYKAEEVDNEFLKALICRLKVKFNNKSQNLNRNFENITLDITVSEILKESYNGEYLCGYDKINHSFSELEKIWRLQKKDWKTPLENIIGVYLITDILNGKRYVGSAYQQNETTANTSNIWDRWSDYLLNAGHGGNKKLKQIIEKKGRKYLLNNFKFTLLEYWKLGTSIKIVLERENYWKEVLLTRKEEYGYNEN